MSSRESWRGAVNSVLHEVHAEEALTSDLAARLAPQLIRHPAGLTAEGLYTELNTAAATGSNLTQLMPDAHSEAAFRTFLSLVTDQMDALRPWPEPPYTELNITQWAELTDPVVIARLTMGAPGIEAEVGTILAELGDIQKRAAVLQLKSGIVVALVTRWWTSPYSAAAVVTEGQQDPDAVIAELAEVTGLTAADFEVTELA